MLINNYLLSIRSQSQLKKNVPFLFYLYQNSQNKVKKNTLFCKANSIIEIKTLKLEKIRTYLNSYLVFCSHLVAIQRNYPVLVTLDDGDCDKADAQSVELCGR